MELPDGDRHRNDGGSVTPVNWSSQTPQNYLDNAVACVTNHVQERALNAVGQMVRKAFPKIIGEDTFNQRLEKLLPRPTSSNRPVKKQLRNEDFNAIAECCKLFGQPEWSVRPRTFAVLYMTGCVNAIDGFIKEQLADYALPFSASNLPESVRGRTNRERFLEYQKLVLTSATAVELETEGAPHQNVEGSADQFFIHRKQLGRGRFGTVDHVYSPLSFAQYARKRILRGFTFQDNREAMKSFSNELKIIKRLSHHHLIKFVGSYTDRDYVGFIMEPVADGNLRQFMDTTPDTEYLKMRLRSFFGCLAVALEYLHTQKVRHKDIKPQNILVHQGDVRLTDFGTSHAWADDSQSYTTGTVKAHTPRYRAPEVAPYQSRNEQADIWSLGCVFVEMCTVLANRTFQHLQDFFGRSGTLEAYYCDNKVALDLWMSEIEKNMPSRDDRYLAPLTRRMCKPDQNERPTAPELVSNIWDLNTDTPYYGICCQKLRANVSNASRDIQLYETPSVERPRSKLPRSSDPNFSLVDCLLDMHYQAPSVQDTDESTLRNVYPEAPISNGMSENDNIDGSLPSNTVAKKAFGNQQLRHSSSEYDAEKHRQPATLEDSQILGSPTETPILQPPAIQVTGPKDEAGSFDRDLRESQGRPSLDDDSGLVKTSHSEQQNSINDQRRESKSLDIQPPPDSDIGSVVRGLESQPLPQRTATGGERPDAHATGFEEPKALSTTFTSAMGNSNRASEGKEALEGVTLHDNSSADSRLVLYQSPASMIESASQNNPRISGLFESSLSPSFTVASRNRLTMGKRNELSSTASPPLFVYGTLMFPAVVKAQAARFASLDGVYSSQLQRRLFTDWNDWSGMDTSLLKVIENMTPAKLEGYRRARPYPLMCSTIRKMDSAEILSQDDLTSTTPELRSPYGETVSGFLLSGLSSEAQSCLDSLFGGVSCFENFDDSAKYEESQKDLKDRLKKALDIAKASNQTKPRKSRQSLPNKERDYGSQRARTDADDLENEVEDLSQIRRRLAKVAGFKRVPVNVCVQDEEKRLHDIKAQTYIWNGTAEFLTHTWSTDEFLRSRTFTRLQGTQSQYDTWMSLEERLAKKENIRFLLPGDELCAAALNSDRKRIRDLIEGGHHINAGCHDYGYILQAAASVGDVKTIELLLRRGAHINARGGRYSTALIAAVAEDHEEATICLLESGASVIECGGQHVSALYQAVGSSNYHMVHTLLEYGGWLSTDYNELLDLAAEKQNRRILNELRFFDVRASTAQFPTGRDQRSIGQTASDSDTATDSDGSTTIDSRSQRRKTALRKKTGNDKAVVQQRGFRQIVKELGFEAFNMRKDEGKWTGSKLVKLLRRLHPDGVSEDTLRNIRPLISNSRSVMNSIQKSVEERMSREDRQKSVSGGLAPPNVEERSKSDDESYRRRRY